MQASKPGCGTATTAAFEVPPPRTNLQLVLHCGFAVITESLPAATRGAAYSYQLEASGGQTPYKWKKSGKLPKGLKLSKTGVLAGTPSAKLTPGSYPVTVEVTYKSKPKPTAKATLTLQVK